MLTVHFPLKFAICDFKGTESIGLRKTGGGDDGRCKAARTFQAYDHAAG